MKHEEKAPYCDWEKAKSFYYVVKCGSFSEAARFLNISQPSLSRQIGVLERDLGCTLLIRLSNGVQMTAHGKELFDIAEQNYVRMRKFSHLISRNTNTGQPRTIRIAATHPVSSYMLNRHLIAYMKENPHIRFEVLTENYMIDLEINNVDMAIRTFDPDSKNIIQEHIFTLEKKLYASEDYLRTHGEPETVEDLRNHKILIHSDPQRHPYGNVHWISGLGLPDGQRHEAVYSSNSLECLVEAACSGMGIIGGYEEMDIIHNSSLRRILPHIQGEKLKEYLIYPVYLKDDATFHDVKNYILKSLYKK